MKHLILRPGRCRARQLIGRGLVNTEPDHNRRLDMLANAPGRSGNHAFGADAERPFTRSMSHAGPVPSGTGVRLR